ncbi:PAS domain-containing sensor histidine kinase [Halovivax limisalsi]|uniref:PAS domain-containing sensor histidine kinase n=1 Tax=Halovivax limisalsi TaxID=1453760 RepID=UPI001FFCAFD7|nr:GAF domain-containing protein [Halovivax limisalsi]
MSGDSALERISDVYFTVDSDWRLTHCNQSARGLFDDSNESVAGRLLWDVLPPGLDETFSEVCFEAMRSGTMRTADCYAESGDTWYESRAYPTESGLSVFLLDIDERKRRESHLEQQAAVVSALDDGVITLDADYRIVSVNETAGRALGMDEADLVGEHVDLVTDRASIPDDDTVAIGRAIEEVGTGKATQRTLDVSYMVDSSTDHRAEVRIARIESTEASLALVFHDVTDQRDFERLVHSLHEVTRWLLESSDPEEICAIAVHAGSDLLELPISGIWLLDQEQGYLDPIAGTAGAHEEFGGLPRFGPGEGLVWDVFEEGTATLYDDLSEESGVYNPETPLESEIIAPIGSYGVLMTGSFRANRFDETDLELLSTLAENTRAALDRADRERILRDRTERLERQSERLEAVATVLSEELKAELDDVSNSLEPEGGEYELDSTVESVDEAAATLDRAERLIDDIREYARNATSVGPRARIDLETAIDDAVAASRLESAAVVVEDGATLRADPDRFRYLLETIFNDAASRSVGDVTIQIGTVGVDVRPTGSRGFYVLDDASKNPPSGSASIPDFSIDEQPRDGLGLAVARAIAEAHDWSVSIGVGERGGTRFEVRDVTTLEPTSD